MPKEDLPRPPEEGEEDEDADAPSDPALDAMFQQAQAAAGQLGFSAAGAWKSETGEQS